MAKDFRTNYNLSLGIRNNNPGNLREVGINWIGKVGSNKGFTVFSNMDYGIRAMTKDLISKINKGLNTIDKYVPVYAPPSENNTQAYISYIVKNAGIPSNQVLNKDFATLFKLVKAHIGIENGSSANVLNDEDIKTGVLLALGGGGGIIGAVKTLSAEVPTIGLFSFLIVIAIITLLLINF